MKISWHKITLRCHHCNRVTIVMSVAISAKGELLIFSRCDHCKVILEWTDNFAALIVRAFELDQELEAETHPTQKAIAAPFFSETDEREMHDFFHISDPDKLEGAA